MSSLCIANRRRRRLEKFFLPRNPPRFILRLFRLSIPLHAGSYLPSSPEVATPSLDSNAAQGSVSALSLPNANDPPNLGRTFNRRAGKFKINTSVEQDDDAGSASFKLVKKRKNVMSLSASRGKGAERASYRIALHPKWGEMTFARETNGALRCGMEYKLLETVTLSAETTAKLGPKAEYLLKGVASYSREDRDASIRFGSDGAWNVDAKPLWDVVGVRACRGNMPTISAHGHEMTWKKGWPSVSVKAGDGKWRISYGSVEYSSTGLRARVKPKAVFCELSKSDDSIEAEVAADGVRVEGRKERRFKGALRCRALARADTRTGVAFRLGWFF